uniref:NADH dehydrogenase subunit 1 n=1 Tax=Leptophlebia marginata TaxID=551854 RepID=UPI001EE0EE62|nr:NADH dehydrogenase subunit 1 [Leptophlebia marginata]YP_010261358.1 NADH dehydrogenase subunit 1 [Leptophlebia vespertina]UIB40252.1 NADH dehydrogenase subunit 1 [Leptophlebia marginata]UIB40265.1 NADH dehydrogenase subunit 1 [Leptophlebia vespertina]
MFSKDVIMSVISGILLVVCVLVGVAFLTLLERKVLGYIQIRKGPNKVGIWGIPQPFADAIKLFTKEQTFPTVSNYFPYYISPILSLFLSLVVWAIFPFYSGMFTFTLGLLFFLCCTSLGVYAVMVAGWASNSNYALLGGLRAVAQTISYEVSLALTLLTFVFLVEGYNLNDFILYQEYTWFLFLVLPLGLVWFASSLAETNRTPFDFAEGESELVSGFNVEYSSGGFALIFMAEYASILFMSMLFVILFMGGDTLSFYFYFKLTLVSFAFVWVRGTLPRFRYDKLMYVAWKSFLPVALNFLVFFSGLSVLMI